MIYEDYWPVVNEVDLGEEHDKAEDGRVGARLQARRQVLVVLVQVDQLRPYQGVHSIWTRTNVVETSVLYGSGSDFWKAVPTFEKLRFRFQLYI